MLEHGIFVGPPFFIYGLILSIQYGFFKKKLWLKLGLIFLAFCFVLFCSGTLRGFDLHAGIHTLLATLAFFYLFWVVFAEETGEKVREKEVLIYQIERDKVFVRFGKNVSAIAHNIRSKLMAIHGFTEYLEMKIPDNNVYREAIAEQKKAVSNVVGLVDNMMYAVRSYNNDEKAEASLKIIVMSAVNLRRASIKFRRDIELKLNLTEQDSVYVPVRNVLQVIDNMIDNAYEALTNSRNKYITIGTYEDEDYIRLSVKDSGKGIPFCDRCERENMCLNCDEFRIGRSAKEHGAGIGMVFTQNVIRELNGKLKITSKVGSGTKVEIWLPKDSRE